MTVVEKRVYDEVYKFLISAPTLEQIIEFHASEATQERARELLAANRENRLTPMSNLNWTSSSVSIIL